VTRQQLGAWRKNCLVQMTLINQPQLFVHETRRCLFRKRVLFNSVKSKSSLGTVARSENIPTANDSDIAGTVVFP